MDEIYSELELFRFNLLNISAATDTIARSNDRKQHQQQTDQIRKLISECRKTLIEMLNDSGKFRNHDENPSAFKLAVDAWCYDQDGKEKADRMRKKIKDRVSAMKIAFNTISV